MTDDPFFAFDAVEQEIEKKLRAAATPAPELADALLERVRPDVRSDLDALWSQLDALSFDHLYPNYLNHPIRVAGAYAALTPDAGYDELAIALVHNAIEAGVLDRLTLPRRVSHAIEVLTIDRSRETDSAYLGTFYDRIEQEGLIFLKALDKLDNALEWVRYEIEERHARVVLEHVCPRVEREHPRLASYLSDLVEVVRSSSFKARFVPAS